MDQLRDDQVRDLVVDRRAEEDDPLVEQTGVDVEGTLAARRLLDDHGYERAHWRSLGRYRVRSLQRGSPGVQSAGFASLACSSFSGVQSCSRASASSGAIGVASSTARSSASWNRRSSRASSFAARGQHLLHDLVDVLDALGRRRPRAGAPRAARRTPRPARDRRAPRARARGAAPRSRRRAARPARPRASGRAARGSAERDAALRRRRARGADVSSSTRSSISSSGSSTIDDLAERLSDGAAVEAVDLARDALAEHALDVGAQLGERVELGDARARLVVERRAGRAPRRRAASGSNVAVRPARLRRRVVVAGTSTSIVFLLAGAHADDALLHLREDAPAPSSTW